MKIYVKNPDTLKPRIKKLKQALNSFDGISASLGLCRDLVAKSLGWDDWNQLHLGHSKTGKISGDILFIGRWSQGELNKEKCLERLVNLITEHFGEVIARDEDKTALAMAVWGPSENFLQDVLNKSKTPKLNAIEMPDSYLRDNVLVDSNTSENYEDFRNGVLLPRLSRQGGILFCSPTDAKSAIDYFSRKNIHHGVITSSDYVDLVSSETLSKKSVTKQKITWLNDARGVMLNTFKYLLDMHTSAFISPNERDNFYSWLTSTIKVGEYLNEPKFNARNCMGLNEDSERRINHLIESLSSQQLRGVPISIAEIVAPDYPLIIISHTDDFLGRVVLGGLLAEIGISKEEILKRERSASIEKTPRLLITGYHEQINMPGMGMGYLFSGSANWTVVLPQNCLGRFDGEMPYLAKNVANVICLAPKTIKRALFREPLARWFCVRNGKTSLDKVIPSLASYGEGNNNLSDSVYAIPLKW